MTIYYNFSKAARQFVDARSAFSVGHPSDCSWWQRRLASYIGDTPLRDPGGVTIRDLEVYADGIFSTKFNSSNTSDAIFLTGLFHHLVPYKRQFTADEITVLQGVIHRLKVISDGQGLGRNSSVVRSLATTAISRIKNELPLDIPERGPVTEVSEDDLERLKQDYGKIRADLSDPFMDHQRFAAIGSLVERIEQGDAVALSSKGISTYAQVFLAQRPRSLTAVHSEQVILAAVFYYLVQDSRLGAATAFVKKRLEAAADGRSAIINSDLSHSLICLARDKVLHHAEREVVSRQASSKGGQERAKVLTAHHAAAVLSDQAAVNLDALSFVELHDHIKRHCLTEGAVISGPLGQSLITALLRVNQIVQKKKHSINALSFAKLLASYLGQTPTAVGLRSRLLYALDLQLETYPQIRQPVVSSLQSALGKQGEHTRILITELIDRWDISKNPTRRKDADPVGAKERLKVAR